MIRELVMAGVAVAAAAAAVHGVRTYREAERPVPPGVYTPLGSLEPARGEALGRGRSAGHRDLFASAPPPSPSIVLPPPALPKVRTGGGAVLDQLSAGGQVLRVRAVFITTGKAGAVAAVEVSGSGQQGAESRRVRVGDAVGENQVVAIEPARVRFRATGGEEFTLKIFEEKKSQ